MTKTTTVYKDPRATELCNEIRYVYNINPKDGWIARPHHTNKEIRIGHPLYGEDQGITAEVDALYHTIEHLGLAEAIGYAVVVVK